MAQRHEVVNALSSSSDICVHALGIDPHQYVRDINERPVIILPETALPLFADNILKHSITKYSVKFSRILELLSINKIVCILLMGLR